MRLFALVCALFIMVQPLEAKSNKIGVLWTSWDTNHFQNYDNYISRLQSWGINYVSLNPTYFIDTYEDGITTQLWGRVITPNPKLQKSVVKELIRRGFVINFRPHIDPIKYAMPLGEPRDSWDTDPGGRDWRGKFDRFDPMNPNLNYLGKVIQPSLDLIAEAIREAGVPANPIRFDIGAELMDSMLYYPESWVTLLKTVRERLKTDYPDVADHITLSYNFCHHIGILLRLDGHEDYLRRIVPDQKIDAEQQYLDRPNVGRDTKSQIASFIVGLDELSISQYLPLDIYNTTDDAKTTTPQQVSQALLHHERNFIDEVLVNELGIDRKDIPTLHIGEYGMGWRGLVAPNVWDVDDWVNKGAGHLILNDVDQKKHASIAIDGVIDYVNQSPQFKSFLLWLGGEPYDVLNLNPYSNWYNPQAANSLRDYWKPKLIPKNNLR